MSLNGGLFHAEKRGGHFSFLHLFQNLAQVEDGCGDVATFKLAGEGKLPDPIFSPASRLNNRMHIISPGQDFSIAGIDGVVLSVGPDDFSFEHADASWHLKVGKNLRSIIHASGEASDSRDEATFQDSPEAEPQRTG